jgi:hypothetical protein
MWDQGKMLTHCEPGTFWRLWGKESDGNKFWLLDRCWMPFGCLGKIWCSGNTIASSGPVYSKFNVRGRQHNIAALTTRGTRVVEKNARFHPNWGKYKVVL